jgi:hypothetical protein
VLPRLIQVLLSAIWLPGSVLVNFRGEAINVPAGQTVVLKAVPRGTFTYSSTFSIPAGASNAVTQGAVSGEVVFKAGTKVLIIYSSTLIDGTYTLYATISSTDDLTEDDNPTGP